MRKGGGGGNGGVRKHFNIIMEAGRGSNGKFADC